MDVNEIISRLIILKQELELRGKDLADVQVYSKTRRVEQVEILEEDDDVSIYIS